MLKRSKSKVLVLHPRTPAALLALALFVVAVPSALALPGPGLLSSPTWAILPMPHADRPADILTPSQLAASGIVPEIQGGIGPGSALQQHAHVGDAGGYICSAAFILRDPSTATYYLSTAGHCIVVDEADPHPYTGAADPDKMNKEFLICVASCIDNALGVGTYVTLRASEDYQPAVFGQSGGVGNDFGILELPADVHDQIRPNMPQWGGPTGTASTNAGDILVQFGHGAYCCPATGAVATRTPADQGRIGVSLGSDDSSFSAAGQSSGGDSGSGVSLGSVSGDVVSGAEAVGVLTHGIAVPGTIGPSYSGTTLGHGLAMVKEHTGLELELVLAGDPVDTAPVAPATGSVSVTDPADGATVSRKGMAWIRGTADAENVDLNDTYVQVSVDDSTYADAKRLPVAGLQAWEAQWDTASWPAGGHVLHVRLVHGDDVLAETNRSVSLSSTAKPTPRPTTPTVGPDPDVIVDPSDPTGAATDDPAAEPVDDDTSTPMPGAALLAVAVCAMAVAGRRLRRGG